MTEIAFKTIDAITRTKTEIEVGDRIPGRDDTGDYKISWDNIRAQFQFDNPVGTISMYGGDDGGVAPTLDASLYCDGSLINPASADYDTYFQLYGIIGGLYDGGTYNTGQTPQQNWDAGNTVALPNYEGIAAVGTGSQDINGRTKTGPVFGETGEDQGQRLTGGGPSGGGRITTRRDNSKSLIMDGAFSDVITSADSGAGAATGTLGVILDFNSANSPDARASTDTDGTTEVNRLGSRWYIRFR